MSVVLDGLFYNGSGFAEDNRILLKCLSEAGISTKIITRDSPSVGSNEASLSRHILLNNAGNINHNDIYICNLMAGAVRYNPNYRVNIARTMFETDRLPISWVTELNRFDEVWVATQFNQETFSSSGVTVPIYVVPSIIDYTRYTIDGPDYPLPCKNHYRFLSIFDWQSRKGYDILLEAFLREFTKSDDVCLIIKTYTLSTNRDPLSEMDRLITQYHIASSRADSIYVINSTLTESELISLYRSVDAFVLPTKGEGWGRPLFEAMALGLPAIGTHWSGQTEFMTFENSFPVRVQAMETIDDSEFAMFNGHQWAIPSVDDLRVKMRYVFEHQVEAAEKGKLAQNELRSKFNLKLLSEIITSRLKHHRVLPD